MDGQVVNAISEQSQHNHGCRRQEEMPCLSPNFAVSESLRALLSRRGGPVSGLLHCSCGPNLSQHQHQNWHQHGETWDSLVAALRETKISIRAGIRGPYERVTFWTGRPSNLGAQHCGTALSMTMHDFARGSSPPDSRLGSGIGRGIEGPRA